MAQKRPGAPKKRLSVTRDQDTLTIVLAEHFSLEIELEDGGVTLSDSNENKLVMNAAGITLDTEGALTLNAKKGVAISTPADLTFDGSNVTAAAQMAFEAKGGLSTKVTASGELTLAATMIMIN